MLQEYHNFLEEISFNKKGEYNSWGDKKFSEIGTIKYTKIKQEREELSICLWDINIHKETYLVVLQCSIHEIIEGVKIAHIFG